MPTDEVAGVLMNVTNDSARIQGILLHGDASFFPHNTSRTVNHALQVLLTLMEFLRALKT